MLTLFLIIFCFFLFFVPFVPFFIFNLPGIIKFLFKDSYTYFKYKKYNNFTGYGNIYLFSANGSQVFGSGKTASLVNQVFSIYHRYNNKVVYDFDSGKFVTQKIHVISNVELFGIDYIPFTGVNQFIHIIKAEFINIDKLIDTCKRNIINTK